jgi:4-hydroxyphenylpyruvate dioxygenase
MAVIDLPNIPKRMTVDGGEFIEFATQGAEATALENILHTLGFSRSGTHVAKALTLWTSGRIRIVVNREVAGYASVAYAAHGTTVCDIGLRVNDAAATVARATHLGAQPFVQHVGPSELDIPAIRGLSGSVLHFIDDNSGLSDVWNIEFTPTGENQRDAGLTHVDHIAQTMSYDEMLSWSLFYSTLFDMNRSLIVDVIDPDGLIRSQAIEDENGSFRITLNGAETHRTMAGSFLADSFGASVQHIALATDDIFTTARQLFENGFVPMPMTANYYADLASRFDLNTEALVDLQSFHILYDEDGDGGFYQLYSQPFAGGIFIEITQRRDGYAGYGAPNAPFRIAAQKRLFRPKGMPRIAAL